MDTAFSGRGTHAPVEPIAHARLAVELDPLSLLTQGRRPHGPITMPADTPKPSRRPKRALEIDSTFSRAHYWLGMSYEQMARHSEAIRRIQGNHQTSRTDSGVFSGVGARVRYCRAAR